MDEIELLRRKLERERKARQQAEEIAETKTLEIFRANQELRELANHLEETVEQRTAELARSRDEALAASQAKSQFLANMSHELRTPLNAILGYSEMLLEEAGDLGLNEAEGDLHKIHSAGRHLLELINDILDLSKIEAKRMELYLEQISPSRLLEEVCSTAIPLFTQHNNRFTAEIDELPTMILSDETKLRQILYNLLSNAAKFTENGTVTLRAGHRDGMLLFEVSDSGIGITPEQQERLFTPFTQADASTTRKYGGTGLGLAITRSFCTMMGGSIHLDSQPGHGTTFHVELPVEVKPAENEDETVAAITTAEPELVGEREPTILVIDDDPVVRELIGRALAHEGYRIEAASSGPEGLRMATILRPDVITLDVMMAGMDGWQVLSALKQNPELDSIPVVMITMVDDRRVGHALGAVDYLLKPIDFHHLRNVISRHGRICPGFHVLLIEDDPDTRELTRRLLEGHGMTVSEAENGQVALQRLEETTPCLVILDLMMPVMDGFEFVSELRRDPRWEELPVVVVTARQLDEDDRLRLAGNVQSLLHKGGINNDLLLKQVRRLAELHRCPPDHHCPNDCEHRDNVTHITL